MFSRSKRCCRSVAEAQQQLHDYNANHPDEPALLLFGLECTWGKFWSKKILIWTYSAGRQSRRSSRIARRWRQILVSHSVYDSAPRLDFDGSGVMARSWRIPLERHPEATRIVEVCPKEYCRIDLRAIEFRLFGSGRGYSPPRRSCSVSPGSCRLPRNFLNHIAVKVRAAMRQYCR